MENLVKLFMENVVLFCGMVEIFLLTPTFSLRASSKICAQIWVSSIVLLNVGIKKAQELKISLLYQ